MAQKLYIATIGPNSTVLVDYLKLKKISVPQQVVDIIANENRTNADFMKVTPFKTVPCLVMANGHTLSEAIPIIEYLEELHPANPLIGTTPEERAETRMWWRWCDLQICEPLLDGFRYAEGIKIFESRFPVFPEMAPGLKTKAQNKCKFLDGQLAGKDFLCGARFTIADVWLYNWIAFGNNVNQPLNPENKNLAGWLERVKAKLA